MRPYLDGKIKGHRIQLVRGTGFPSDSNGKESSCNAGGAGDTALIPGLGRSPGEGNGNSFQYSCLGNPMDRGGW